MIGVIGERGATSVLVAQATTMSGLPKALVLLAADPPTGLGEYPVIWRLADAST